MVKHKEFIKSKNNIKKLCTANGFIYDVKYIFPEKLIVIECEKNKYKMNILKNNSYN